MTKKYYAVRSGRCPGIYETWEDCKEQVHGYPAAVYKSFSTREEALQFLGVDAPTQEVDTAAIAYVDGSYSHEQKRFSYGAILIYEEKELYFSESFSDPDLATMRNVAGEIMGAAFIMEYCEAHNIPSVTIYYDYAGIENWCTGAWKTNKPGTQNYYLLYKKFSQTVDIRFVKVRGHSGNKYNDLADSLAKKALGIDA